MNGVDPCPRASIMTLNRFTFTIIAGWLAAALLPPLASADQHRLEVLLEKRAADSWEAVEPGRVLEQGDEVRFRVHSNLDGELYAYNRGPGGQAQLIFPRQEVGMDNRLALGRPLTVPPGDGAFSISGPPGHDVVYWVVSPAGAEPPPAPNFGGKLVAAAAPPGRLPRPTPPRLTPSCDETILQARSICVDQTAGPQAMSSQSVSDAFGEGSFQARSIGVEKTAQSAVITASPAPNGVVVFEYRIPHR